MATSHPPPCTPLPWFLEGTSDWVAIPSIPIELLNSNLYDFLLLLLRCHCLGHPSLGDGTDPSCGKKPSQDEGFDLQEENRHTIELQRSASLIGRRSIYYFVELQSTPNGFEEDLLVGLSSTNPQIGCHALSETYPIQAHQWNLNPHLRKLAAHRSCRTFTAPRYSSV